VFGGTLINCILTGNKTGSGAPGGGFMSAGAGGKGGHGGGVYGGTLVHCVLVANMTGNGGHGGFSEYGGYGYGGDAGHGGGVYGSELTQCVLVDNVPGNGGGGNPTGANGLGSGAYSGSLKNSIVWGNTSKDIQNTSSVYYSCAGNAPTGNGNIKTNPQFVDAADKDFRLQSNSPCINTGNNTYAPTGTDVVGNPRIIDGTVDMGACEFFVGQDDFDSDGLPNDWEVSHFGNINHADPNAVCSNGVNTILHAYIAGLDPNDPQSKFTTTVSGQTLRWNATSGRVYAVYYSTNLLDGFQPLATNIPWTAGCFTDSVHNAHGQLFYKIDVRFEGAGSGNPFLPPGGGDDGGDHPSTAI
jgi:hypothetical protein